MWMKYNLLKSIDKSCIKKIKEWNIIQCYLSRENRDNHLILNFMSNQIKVDAQKKHGS